MKISKAVIPLAGKGQRTLPLQTLIDRDGREKSVLEILIEETVQAGVEEIGLIIRPGDQEGFLAVARPYASRLHFVEQKRPLGYGHALYCAKDFVEDQPFLHLVGDHIYISQGAQSCAQHLVDVAKQEGCVVSAVQATRETLLPQFGAIGGQRLKESPNRLQISTVLEKPTPTQAEQNLLISGLRAGHYLCFFGMHVLTPTLMPILENQLSHSPQPEAVSLSSALHTLAQKERVLALVKDDRRYNLGARYGLMLAQMALALSGKERDFILTQLLEQLAQSSPPSDAP